jgi:hypothetical protein
MCTQDFGIPDGPIEPNMTILNQIITNASQQCDALVASIYNVPFTGYVPQKIYTASIFFTLYALQSRRKIPDEKNQFKADADYWRVTLIDIGKGNQPLDANIKRAFTPIVSQVSHTRINTNIF